MKLKLIILLLFPYIISAQDSGSHKAITAQQVVELIKKNVTCPWDEKTVDTFKAGDSQAIVKGIAVCMFADMYVLKDAVKKNCNFIITHEPTFYNHTDDTGFLKDDRVYREKKKFIDENRLVIWRFHDHWHKTSPDGIYSGMIGKLGWEAFATDKSLTRFEVPETTLSKLVNEVSNKLNVNNVRTIGDPQLKITKVGFLAGAPGSRSQIAMLGDDNIDLLIGGEVPEWETYMYVKDAVALGMKKGVIFLGHIKSEEEGMNYCAGWLKSFVRGVPIVFIKNNPNFQVKKMNKI